jgi:hypothetical protein
MEVEMGTGVVGPAFGVWPRMTIYEQKLWFDSCAADSAILVLTIALVVGGLAVVIRYINNWGGASRYYRIRGYALEYLCWALVLASCTAYIFGWGLERTVRLAILGNNIEIVKCAARAAVRAEYPLAAVAFDYHFEESSSRVGYGPGHHMLDIRHQQTGEQLAKVEMGGSFELQALRGLAPNAWAAYLCQRGQKRVRDECRIMGRQP